MITIDGGGWRAAESDKNPYFRVEFITPVHIIHTVTQGHQDHEEWVTSYQVSYRLGSEENYQWVRDQEGNIMVSICTTPSFRTNFPAGGFKAHSVPRLTI